MPAWKMQKSACQERFRALMEQHQGIVFKIVNTYCFVAEDRRDLAQEIAVQLWRVFPKYDGQRSFSTWMYRIALNVAISQVRTTIHRGRYVVPLDEDLHDRPEDGLDVGEKEDRVRALHAFITAQHDLDRALLLLYLDERPHQEIADILGISTSNVGTRIGRLKQRMREALRIPEHYS